MTAKLTKELTAALQASGESGLEVVDPQTQRTYVVIDAAIHRQAMEALRRQQNRDAIAQGIAEMEAGEEIPVEQARHLARERLLAREP
jgi:predicted transcriptional regulator